MNAFVFIWNIMGRTLVSLLKFSGTLIFLHPWKHHGVNIQDWIIFYFHIGFTSKSEKSHFRNKTMFNTERFILVHSLQFMTLQTLTFFAYWTWFMRETSDGFVVAQQHHMMKTRVRLKRLMWPLMRIRDNFNSMLKYQNFLLKTVK